jgi:uncharacterized protein YeaO (DUF488 family)
MYHDEVKSQSREFERLLEYSDDELIWIICEEKDEWQNAAVEYAKDILQERGLSESFIEKRYHNLRAEFEQNWQEELEARKTEDFHIISLAFMVLFWPREVLRNWYLKREGYHRKSRQRLIAIGIGVLAYLTLIINANLSADDMLQQRIAEIDRLATLDSIATSKID